ncbi:MAG: N-acetylglucosamine-6-phosphate deacetylase [Dehalococcoidia bacterium]
MQSSGLFDIQVNGFAGVDFNSPQCDAEGLDHALEAMLACGVTACLPTLITASFDELAERFAALDRAVASSRFGPVMVPGYHLEGPFLNSATGYSGCHPTDQMMAPDPALVETIQKSLKRPILLVTLAPELPGSEVFIRRMVMQGRIVAIGHSAADEATVSRAVAAGASLSTHLGNGLPATLPKLANPIWAQLADDRLWASLIADGIHVPPATLKVMIRAKGVNRCILTTDAISAAASAPGFYPFAGMNVEHREDGSARLPGSPYLAGSALSLNTAVRNVVTWVNVTSLGALRMASENPRGLLAGALTRHEIRLEPGRVEWSADLAIIRVRLGSVDRCYREPS